MPPTDLSQGRTNQKVRTRLGLLETARRMLEDGQDPTLEEVAEAAMVSRATAYRYFSSIDELRAEAFIGGPDLGTPQDVLAEIGSEAGLAERVDHVVRHLSRHLLDNPRATHLMMRSLYDVWLDEPDSRPARRLDFLEAALAGHTDSLSDADRDRLLHGLAIVCGAEATLAAVDVCRLDPERALDVLAWAARVIVDRVLEESGR